MSKKEERLDIIYEGEFTTNIPDEIVMSASASISHGAFRAWVVLRRFARRPEEDGIKECYPSMKTIADALGLSTEQARKYVRELSEIGLLLDIKRRVRKEGWGVFNVYRMVNPRIWLKRVGKMAAKVKKENKRALYSNYTKKENSTG